MSDQTILEVKDLKKYFSIGKKQLVHAVDGVSFRLDRGKTLGLVGESGCGKSTCARTIIRMYDVTGGSIVLDGTDITNMNQKELKPLRRKMQMIFQDPYASLNARMTVRDIIAEPLIAHNVVKNKAESTDLVYAMLDRRTHEGAREPVCPRIFRRPAPARRHSESPDPAAGARHLRRAHLRSGRIHPGPGHQPA